MTVYFWVYTLFSLSFIDGIFFLYFLLKRSLYTKSFLIKMCIWGLLLSGLVSLVVAIVLFFSLQEQAYLLS